MYYFLGIKMDDTLNWKQIKQLQIHYIEYYGLL